MGLRINFEFFVLMGRIFFIEKYFYFYVVLNIWKYIIFVYVYKFLSCIIVINM